MKKLTEMQTYMHYAKLLGVDNALGAVKDFAKTAATNETISRTIEKTSKQIIRRIK